MVGSTSKNEPSPLAGEGWVGGKMTNTPNPSGKED
jgi:hypothetical protein